MTDQADKFGPGQAERDQPSAPSLLPDDLRHLRAADAIDMQHQARGRRALAAALRNTNALDAAAECEALADQLDDSAAAVLDIAARPDRPAFQAFGELVVATPQECVASGPTIIDTVKQTPDMLTADASRQRLSLLRRTGNVNLGMDAAVSIQAGNSLEKMLAHQLATAHHLALETAAVAQESLDAFHRTGHSHPNLSVEAARLMGAAARMMGAYQSGLLTLERIRNGGKQTVVVQHVNVAAEQAQVAIAGQVEAQRRRRRKQHGG